MTSSSWSPAPAPTCRRCSTPAADPAYGARVVAVGADRDGIEGLARAERAGIPTFVAPRSGPRRPARTGTRRSPSRSRRTTRPGRPRRLHEAGRRRRSSPRSAAASSTPTPRCCRRSPACTGRATRWRTASRSPARRCSSSTTGVDTGADRRPRSRCRSSDDDTVETPARADQGRRARDARRPSSDRDGPRAALAPSSEQEGHHPVSERLRRATAPSGRRPIRRALVSVYDKTGLEELAPRPARRRRRAGVDRVDGRPDRGARASR